MDKVLVISRYRKGEGTRVSNHFISSDFDCRCSHPKCKWTYVCAELVFKLEELVTLTGVRPEFNSAYRCPRHNFKTPGSSEYSQHMFGLAVDIKTDNPNKLSKQLSRVGFSGIGIYRSFVHGDVRGEIARW